MQEEHETVKTRADTDKKNRADTDKTRADEGDALAAERGARAVAEGEVTALRGEVAAVASAAKSEEARLHSKVSQNVLIKWFQKVNSPTKSSTYCSLWLAE